MAEKVAFAPPPNVTVVTPGNWFEIPLPSTLSDEEIANRVRQRAAAFPALSEAALTQGIAAGAAACREVGSVWAAMMLEVIDGHALIATAVVSVTDASRWATTPLTADGIALEFVKLADGTWDIMTGRLPAGLMARIWHMPGLQDETGRGATDLTITYYFPVPESATVVSLACFSPNVDLADAMTGQFDAMAYSLRLTS